MNVERRRRWRANALTLGAFAAMVSAFVPLKLALIEVTPDSYLWLWGLNVTCPGMDNLCKPTPWAVVALLATYPLACVAGWIAGLRWPGADV